MKKLLYGVAALPLLTSLALAGQPVQLTDHQMDKVTAGYFHVTEAGIILTETTVTNTSLTSISINDLPTACVGCYLNLAIGLDMGGVLSIQSIMLQ